MLAETLGPNGLGCYKVTWTDSGQPSLDPSFSKPEVSLIPGFVDVHIHGGFGTDFMSASRAELLTLCNKLSDIGYEGLLFTTVTSPIESIQNAIKQLPDHPIVLGFHLEGPFISEKYPGAQSKQHILKIPDKPSEWDAIFDHPQFRMITLAPELEGSEQLIKRLTQHGVRVSLGHSDATFAETQAAFNNGAKSITHIFNALRPFHHREVGIVGFALSDDNVFTEIIYDRHHACFHAAKLLIKNKPYWRILAVSDGTLASGLPEGTEFNMWEETCIIKDQMVLLKDSEVLAGSNVTLLDIYRNIADDFGPELALRMCSLNPRKLLGITDPPHRWIILDRNKEILEIKG